MAAAYGGGGVGLLGALAAGTLIGQAKLARRAIGMAQSPPPRCDGVYGTELGAIDGQLPLKLAVLGDSSAAGYGVDRPRETPGALLAAGLAERLHRPVILRSMAVVGAESADLVPQREVAVDWQPDLAVVLIGANDVTHRVRLPIAVAHLAATVRRLRQAGIQVVVGTCPDLGTIRPIGQPLRWVVRRWSREMAAAQTIVAVEAGATTVSLGDLLGPEFAAAPETMFSSDRFHPSALGYAAAAAAMLPTLVEALHPAPEAQPSLSQDEGVRSLAQAAVEAVDRAGTEVRGARVAGRDNGPAGRWAQLRHRVRQLTERPHDPQTTHSTPVQPSVVE
ncbi:lipase [Rugosimonospora africana]|uniref:Lipase n=1 Tax=Rugosimonospora africana TaxID=556532 RepID=A0A8J3QN29_9ACTN|nr:SGNH/GDSL hydrolase family protein [Rugosimonospora africana]GIH12081.1 lipase [Rugosimonospora africana]